MFEVYLDGCYIKSFDTEDEAEVWCELYDGDQEPSYEYVGDTGLEEPISDCGPF